MRGKGEKQLRIIEQAHLQIQSDLRELDYILKCFEEFDHSWIPHKIWLQCQLAVVEGFTNAVRHAHKDLPRELNIDIEVILFAQGWELRIWDHGPPFDLNERIEEILSSTENNLSGGGRGLEILSKVSDHLSYSRTEDQRNCLLMRKYYSPQQR